MPDAASQSIPSEDDPKSSAVTAVVSSLGAFLWGCIFENFIVLSSGIVYFDGRHHAHVIQAEKSANSRNIADIHRISEMNVNSLKLMIMHGHFLKRTIIDVKQQNQVKSMHIKLKLQTSPNHPPVIPHPPAPSPKL